MSDEVDTTNDMILLNTEMLIQQARRSLPEVVATGYCLDEGCGLEVSAGRRWCDADCRTCWEKDKRRAQLVRISEKSE